MFSNHKIIRCETNNSDSNANVAGKHSLTDICVCVDFVAYHADCDKTGRHTLAGTNDEAFYRLLSYS